MVASKAFITIMILVCHIYASVLFDERSTYSYVSSYFTSHLDMHHGSLEIHIHVSTHVGDPIMVDPVYGSCQVTIGGY